MSLFSAFSRVPAGERGFTVSSCFTRPGKNLAPDTLRLVCTEATITQLSVGCAASGSSLGAVTWLEIIVFGVVIVSSVVVGGCVVVLAVVGLVVVVLIVVGLVVVGLCVVGLVVVGAGVVVVVVVVVVETISIFSSFVSGRRIRGW